MLFYNLILINVFLLTIRNNYADVNEKNQKFNEAFAMILGQRSMELNTKLFNFLLCGDPVLEEEKPKIEVFLLRKKQIRKPMRKKKFRTERIRKRCFLRLIFGLE